MRNIFQLKSKRLFLKPLSLILGLILSVDQLNATNTHHNQSSLASTDKQSQQTMKLWDKNVGAQFTYVQIIVQVAMQIATHIMNSVMKIKQREQMLKIITESSHIRKGLSVTAISGSQAARVAKLLQQPEVNYETYLTAAKQLAEARKQTEENLKGAAENREAAAREADAAAKRIYLYNNSRGGEDFEAVAKKLVLEDAAAQLNNYVNSVQKEVKAMNDMGSLLNKIEGKESTSEQPAAAASGNTHFTADETSAITADMLINTTKEQFASSGEALVAATNAHEQAAKATEAFNEAGNAYTKYLEDKNLSEHPTGDAKADELRANWVEMAKGLSEPYSQIDQTSVEVSNQLNAALGQEAPAGTKKDIK